MALVKKQEKWLTKLHCLPSFVARIEQRHTATWGKDLVSGKFTTSIRLPLSAKEHRGCLPVLPPASWRDRVRAIYHSGELTTSLIVFLIWQFIICVHSFWCIRVKAHQFRTYPIASGGRCGELGCWDDPAALCVPILPPCPVAFCYCSIFWIPALKALCSPPRCLKRIKREHPACFPTCLSKITSGYAVSDGSMLR